MPRLLILDFDGTLTDAEEEGLPYKEGYLEDVALLANVEMSVATQWALEIESTIQQNPGSYGWRFKGQIVAPAIVDPYLRMMPIARGILDRANAFTNDEERERILDRILYKYNYTKTHTVFRPGACQFFQTLREQEFCDNPIYTVVVTNSHTIPVQEKIALLGEQNGVDFSWLVERVVGSAKKYILDNSATHLPESMHIPNLERPVYLQRSHYAEILASIQDTYNCNWTETTVLGDIFELDLSLPLHLGATVGLMQNPFSPAYEVEYLKHHERGAVHTDLNAALNWILQLN
jgi:FMN phosphatase YigB (HAD superfamily)